MTSHKLILRALMAATVVLSVLVTSGLLGTPVAAQSASNNSTSTTAAPAQSGDDCHWWGCGPAGDGNASNSSGDGDPSLGVGAQVGVGGYGASSWLKSAANWTSEKLMNALEWQIGLSMQLWIGTPYAKLGSNGLPTNEPFQTIFEEAWGPYIFQFLLIALGIFIMLTAMAMGAIPFSRGGSIMMLLRNLGMAIIVVGIGFDFINLTQHLANGIAWGIAPKPEEFTESMAGIFKVGAGPIVGIIGLYFTGWTEALALGLVYSIRQAFLMAAPFLVPPLLLVAWGGAHPRLKMFGSVLFWQWFGLTFVTVPVAMLLRIAFELEWSFGVSGIVGFLFTLAIFFIALVLPFVVSFTFFKYPMTGMAMGAAGRVTDRAGSARDRYSSWRGGDDKPTQAVESKTETSSPSDRVAVTDGGYVDEDGGITDKGADELADRINHRSDSETAATASRIRAADQTANESPRLRTTERKSATQTKRSRRLEQYRRGSSSPGSGSESQYKPVYRLSYRNRGGN